MIAKVDWKILTEEYINNNLITANKHYEYDLWILNYTPKAQSKKIWDEYTLSCRGLVIDSDGNIIARPFIKFFNYEELEPGVIDMTQKYEIFEKMDGSMIELFYYENKMTWMTTTRGSFISEQSVEAWKMVNDELLSKLDKTKTYVFEILYFENTIVVNYGKRRELVLLGVIDTKTGDELSYDDVKLSYSTLFTVVTKYEYQGINNLLDLRKYEEDNKEGYVIKIGKLRVKVKFLEYCRLHAVLTNVSNVIVWEHLKNNYNFDILIDRVPDEFYNWLNRTAQNLINEYDKIELVALKEFFNLYHVNGLLDRKEFAMEAIKSEHRSILFKMYNKAKYDELIWNKIKPNYLKPFRDGYDY
jgi:RNA ligase